MFLVNRTKNKKGVPNCIRTLKKQEQTKKKLKQETFLQNQW